MVTRHESTSFTRCNVYILCSHRRAFSTSFLTARKWRYFYNALDVLYFLKYFCLERWHVAYVAVFKSRYAKSFFILPTRMDLSSFEGWKPPVFYGGRHPDMRFLLVWWLTWRNILLNSITPFYTWWSYFNDVSITVYFCLRWFYAPILIAVLIWRPLENFR